MDFKGHINLRIISTDVRKLAIVSKTGNEPFMCHEYYYSNGRLIKHIDFINWKVSIHEYDNGGNRTELRTFGFDDKPENTKLEGYKRFEYESGKLKKEFHYLFFNNEEKLQYEGFKIYDGNELIQEDYHYPNQIYTIKHHFERETNIKTLIYPEDNGNPEYYFDNNGFLISFINYKQNEFCQINDYQYKDDKLHKLIGYPYLKYRKEPDSKKIEIIGQGQFIHETEYFYDNSGKIEKEVKTDILNNLIVDELEYKYEN